MTIKKKPVLTAIVLQGGAAMGAYEVGALKALYEARGPGFQPDVLTGISSAGGNAVILAGAGISALEEVWRKQFAIRSLESLMPFGEGFYQAFLPPVVQQGITSLSNMQSSGLYRVRPEVLLEGPAAFWASDSIGDTTPLQETLRKVVDFGKLNNGEIRVVLTAVNAATGKPAAFGNARSFADYAKQGKPSPFANKGYLSIEHVLASGAFPIGFPPYWLDGSCYEDGGLFLSTPLSEAINALENYDTDEEVEREVIVIDAFPLAGMAPTNMLEAYLRSVYILYGNKIELDNKLFERTNSYIDFARDVTQLEEAIEKLGPEPAPGNKALTDAIAEVKRIMEHIKREDHGYRNLAKEHRTVDYFTRIPFIGEPQIINPADFTASVIEARMAAGYQQAKVRKIGEYQPVPHTNLLKHLAEHNGQGPTPPPGAAPKPGEVVSSGKAQGNGRP